MRSPPYASSGGSAASASIASTDDPPSMIVGTAPMSELTERLSIIAATENASTSPTVMTPPATATPPMTRTRDQDTEVTVSWAAVYAADQTPMLAVALPRTSMLRS